MSRTKMSSWAQDFYQIQETVNENTDLKSDIAELVRSEPIHGKVIEGEGRAESLREILLESLLCSVAEPSHGDYGIPPTAVVHDQ